MGKGGDRVKIWAKDMGEGYGTKTNPTLFFSLNRNSRPDLTALPIRFLGRRYSQFYDKCWAYCWAHLADTVHGGWFGVLGPNNEPQPHPEYGTGHTKSWFSDYHSMGAVCECIRTLQQS